MSGLPKRTPVAHYYAALKAEYPDAIVLLRLGDFYEALGDDAQTMHDVCGSVINFVDLDGERTKMVGCPWFSADAYARELQEAGYRVAMIESVYEETPAEGQQMKLFRREKLFWGES